MPKLLEPGKVPTSVGDAKRLGMDAAGYAVTGATVILGLGLLAFALPLVAQVPILGGFMRQGLGFWNANSGRPAATADAFGGV